MSTHFIYWVISQRERKKEKEAAMVTVSFPPLTAFPSLSTPKANDSSNMHSRSLTGRAFEITLPAANHCADVVQQGCH